MLHTFLTANRIDLIARCRIKAMRRPSRPPLSPGFEYGIPQFLDQVIKTLELEQTPDRAGSERVSGAAGGLDHASSDVGASAALHGRELLLHGFTVEEVVHDYGDLCQAITELADESGIDIAVDEFHTLNRCLDNAIADAVREYSYGKQLAVNVRGDAAKIQHAFFVHELRNLLNTAVLALAAVRSGKVTANGATGDVLDRSLHGLAVLVERSVAELRGSHGPDGFRTVVPLAEFIGDSFRAAALAAESRGCAFVASSVDPTLAIKVDRDLVFGALSNLLTNAFKFTFYGGEVSLAAYATGERIVITVTDQCGGLAPEAAQQMFTPYVQVSSERSGLGLGLAIARKSVEGSDGTLDFRNIEGKGCVFSMGFPRHLVDRVGEPAPALS